MTLIGACTCKNNCMTKLRVSFHPAKKSISCKIGQALVSDELVEHIYVEIEQVRQYI